MLRRALAMIRRSVREFRRDPGLSFLRRSGSPTARAVARIADTVFTPIHGVLLDPRGVVLRADIPIMTPLARALERSAEKRRRALLAEHDSPSISVIMPALDAAGTIEAAMRSVLQQSYENLELIVVDDGSSDATPAIARAIAAADPRVVVTQNPGPKGAARSRNVGLSLAKGAFIAFHDADDVSDPERFELQLATLLERPNAVVCVCNARRVDDDGTTVPINGKRVARGVITMLFRRAPVLSTMGYFKTELYVSEDSEYFERMKATFGEGAAVDLFKTLYHQRFSPTSLLFSDGEVRRDDKGDVSHRRSPEADAALTRFRADLRRIARGEMSPYVPF